MEGVRSLLLSCVRLSASNFYGDDVQCFEIPSLDLAIGVC